MNIEPEYTELLVKYKNFIEESRLASIQTAYETRIAEAQARAAKAEEALARYRLRPQPQNRHLPASSSNQYLQTQPTQVDHTFNI